MSIIRRAQVRDQPESRPADQRTGYDPHDHADRDTAPRRNIELHQEKGHRVSAEPEERRMAEGDHPRVAGEHIPRRLLLDSRVVDLSMASNPTFVFLSSLEPLFFNSPENELRFLDNTGA